MISRALVCVMVLVAMSVVGCGDGRSSGGGSTSTPTPTPGPEEIANHPLLKMSHENVLHIHERLALAEQGTLAAHWPALSGHRLYSIVNEELRLSQDLIATNLDQRLFLRLHALLLDEDFHVRAQVSAREILKELNYEYYRGRL